MSFFADTRRQFLEPISDIHEWPIVRLSQERKEFIKEVTNQSVARILEQFKDEASINELLAETLYQERYRIKENPWAADPEDDADFWSGILKQLLNRTLDAEMQGDAMIYQRKIIKSIASRYANEIAGQLQIPTYGFAKKVVPMVFRSLLYASSIQNVSDLWNPMPNLQDRLKIHGDVDTLRSLAKKGTIVMLPTHFSNLDSVLVGWTIREIGLPAFIYGAGLNLFSIKLFAYFMNRLGAYKVDRRKKNDIYLQTLKTYSSSALQYGCHSLFFPGGTRSRSGSIEDHLKLGLLGTTFEAQYMNFLKGNNTKLFVVPVVLNYHFVLEAPSLIDQYLRQEGKEMYLMENDEFSTSYKIIQFVFKFLRAQTELSVSYGQVMDLFGNRVDADGNSYDSLGREVDISRYFMRNGQLVNDPQRHGEYTKMLGELIVDKFHEESYVLSSHLISYTAFEMLKARNKHLDIFGLLRLSEDEREINYSEFADKVDHIRKVIQDKEAEGKVHADAMLSANVDRIIENGLKHLGLYHAKRTLYRKDEEIITTDDMKLLFFYHNRLNGYGLEQYF